MRDLGLGSYLFNALSLLLGREATDQLHNVHFYDTDQAL